MRALAEVLEDAGKHDEALVLLRSAYEGQARVDDVNDFGRLETTIGYARLLRKAGALDDAEPLLRASIDRLEGLVGEKHWLRGRGWRELALIELARGNHKRALEATHNAVHAGIPLTELKATELATLPGIDELEQEADTGQ